MPHSSPPFPFPRAGVTDVHNHAYFYVSVRDPNSGLHDFKAGILLTEPSLYPQTFSILVFLAVVQKPSC